MTAKIADPDKHFAIELHLDVVNNEDYDRLRTALEGIRNEFCRGGSSLSVESVRPGSVLSW